MEIYVQILGWHKLAIPPSLKLFINGESTLFNCGENTQRFINEHKLHLVKTKQIFFTSINPETIGGLIGFLLTFDNVTNGTLHIYGPKPLSIIIDSITSSFAKMKNIHIEVHEIDETSDMQPLLLKDEVVVWPILIKREQQQFANLQELVIRNSELTGDVTDTCMEEQQEREDFTGEETKVEAKTHMEEERANGKEEKIEDLEEVRETEKIKESRENGENGETTEKEEAQKTQENGEKEEKTNRISFFEKNTNLATESKQTKKKRETTTNISQRITKKIKNFQNDLSNLNIQENVKTSEQVFDTVCYLIECPKTLGKFHPEKAKKFNIPKGKYFGILKSGKCVNINGNVVKPEDVCDKNIDGRKALIIDLGKLKDVDFLIEKINNNRRLFLENVEYIFHLANEHIINAEMYKNFFLSLQNLKNVQCNHSNAPLKVCPFVSSASLNNFLSQLLQTVFLKYEPDIPLYDLSENMFNGCDEESLQEKCKEKKEDRKGEGEKNQKEDIKGEGEKEKKEHKKQGSGSDKEEMEIRETKKCVDLSCSLEQNLKEINNFEVDVNKEKSEKYLCFNTLTKFVLHPFHKIEIDTKNILTRLYPNNFNLSKMSIVMKENENLIKTLKEFNERELTKRAHSEFKEEPPAFYFLGTGCSMPSTFRNVSGIILNINKKQSVILDIGEGSIYQLLWMSNSWNSFISIILSVRIIFISHAHADHHAGLYFFLCIRKRLFPNVVLPILLVPKPLKNWLVLFNQLFLPEPLQVVYIKDKMKFTDKYNPEEGNGLTLTFFKVHHIVESYGVKIEHEKIGSVVYSADTRPCDNVQIYATNCDILIHEATFDDELQEEAIQKKHSTTQEAIKLGAKANCKCLILTHFSQRYPKVIFLKNENEQKKTCHLSVVCYNAKQKKIY